MVLKTRKHNNGIKRKNNNVTLRKNNNITLRKNNKRLIRSKKTYLGKKIRGGGHTWFLTSSFTKVYEKKIDDKLVNDKGFNAFRTKLQEAKKNGVNEITIKDHEELPVSFEVRKNEIKLFGEINDKPDIENWLNNFVIIDETQKIGKTSIVEKNSKKIWEIVLYNPTSFLSNTANTFTNSTRGTAATNFYNNLEIKPTIDADAEVSLQKFNDLKQNLTDIFKKHNPISIFQAVSHGPAKEFICYHSRKTIIDDSIIDIIIQNKDHSPNVNFQSFMPENIRSPEFTCIHASILPWPGYYVEGNLRDDILYVKIQNPLLSLKGLSAHDKKRVCERLNKVFDSIINFAPAKEE